MVHEGASQLADAMVAWFSSGIEGPGWYAWYVEYPDEGSIHFDHDPCEAELAECGMRRMAGCGRAPADVAAALSRESK
jgi:hypothetical protein